MQHEMTTPMLGANSNTANKQGLAALTLAAIGVVYGDIGTSPLYTVKEIFAPHTGVPLDAYHLTGAVSAIFWAYKADSHVLSQVSQVFGCSF